MPILFALLSYLGWGTSDVLAVIAGRKLGSHASMLWSSILRTLLLTLYIPLAWTSLEHATPANVLLSAVLSLVFLAGNLLFLEGFRSSNAPLVGAISAAYVAP